MAMEGELAGLDGVTCKSGRSLNPEVLRSAAGYYLGYFCAHCGPYSRETGYYPTRQAAEADLAREMPYNLRGTGLYLNGGSELEIVRHYTGWSNEIARAAISQWEQLVPGWTAWYILQYVEYPDAGILRAERERKKERR